MSKLPRKSYTAVYELLSSMRFAISLLTVLAIASVIGTVLRQNEPYLNYLAQFGQFWFPVFEALGLFDVYHTSWFLLILGFLVISTAICIYRNAPLMVREMRSFREKANETSLRLFAHRADLVMVEPRPETVSQLTRYLSSHRYRFKITHSDDEQKTLLSAKIGSAHRLGYISTHSAIVIICLGGLLDGNIPLEVQQFLGHKKIETRDVPESQVPVASRLPASNVSFRGQVNIPENSSADVVFLNVGDGYMVQELPFTISLKRFFIDHYSTGQPKSFASDIVVFDKQTAHQLEATIKVNHPLTYKGISIYQASFSDGGTHLQILGWPLFSASADPLPLSGKVHANSKLDLGSAQYAIEFTDFRPFNVENLNTSESKVEVASVSKKLMRELGSAAASPGQKDLRNVGPSFQYKLRDAQGQAREYSNYMLPLQFDQRWYLVGGMRQNPNENFRYIRLPLSEGSLEPFMRLRAIVFDSTSRAEVARRFAQSSLSGEAISSTLLAKLVDTTNRVLEIFAGGGYEALAKFIDQAVPPEEQERAAQIYLKILENAALTAHQLARANSGLESLALNAETLQFVRDSLDGINDSFFYGAPIFLQLTQFEEIKASGLQLTRSPGQNIVYLGSALLILGVFAMFYLRERRIWLLVEPQHGRVLFAMSGNRKTLDFEREFEQHKRALADLLRT